MRLGAWCASGRAGAGGHAGGRSAGARDVKAGRRQRPRQAWAQAGASEALGEGRAAWTCQCAQAGRAGWSTGPSWCTVHLT